MIYDLRLLEGLYSFIWAGRQAVALARHQALALARGDAEGYPPGIMTEQTLYRLADPASLARASIEGVFDGEALDRADGFIHLSTRGQLAGTLETHFSHVTRAALAEIDAGQLGAALKWERSRDGEMFPHHYGQIAFAAIGKIHLMSRSEDAAWQLPEALT